MKIKLWGVRGSIAAPQNSIQYRNRLQNILQIAQERLRDGSLDISAFLDDLPPHLRTLSGGNTTCVSLFEDDGSHPIFLDAGTGIRPLGQEFAGPCSKGGCEFHIFFTHTHWDHIQGLPFFVPVYIPGNTIHIYSTIQDMEERMAVLFSHRFHPVDLSELGARLVFHRIHHGEAVTFPDGRVVDTAPLKHPGGSTAYRIRRGGRSFVFATDAEFTGADLEKPDSYHDFFYDSDLLIIDSQYTLDESFSRFDWGHTSYTMAVNCAVRWNVKHLVLTHHDPGYSDTHLLNNFREAIAHRDRLNKTRPRIHLAQEGTVFWLKEKER